MSADFQESSARPRMPQIPYAHLSIELDHLYMEDLVGEGANLGERMARVRPWHDAIVASFAAAGLRSRPRVSTCVLIDDYFSSLVSPADVVPRLREAAARAGLQIDYLARESCCAQIGRVSPALLAADRLVQTPAAETDGSRPPTKETGWLSNGRRSPAESRFSMQSREWTPPVEANARRHSVFVDVELWDEVDGKRVWSCAMLAAVWQLLRLGLLRDQGRPLIVPEPLDPEEGLPDSWDALPPVLQLEERAAPFTGYRTASILDHRFMPVEHAVRVILGQVRQDSDALEILEQRARGEGLREADGVLGRLGYVFLPDREA